MKKIIALGLCVGLGACNANVLMGVDTAAPLVEGMLCKQLAKDKIVKVKTCTTLAGVVVSTATAAAQSEMAPAPTSTSN